MAKVEIKAPIVDEIKSYAEQAKAVVVAIKKSAAPRP